MVPIWIHRVVTVGSQCGTWVICALGGALVLVGPSITPEIGVAWPAHRGGGAVLHTEEFVNGSSDSCCCGSSLGDGAIGVLEIVPMLGSVGIGGLAITPMFVGWVIGVLVLAPSPAVDCDGVVVGVGAGVCSTIPLDGGSPSGRAGGAADNESVRAPWCCPSPARLDPRPFATFGLLRVDVVIEIGRASCRERV